MRANAARPDFEPEGSLALKPWFGVEPGACALPPELDLPVVEAVAPYDEQIERAQAADRRGVCRARP